MLASLWNVLTGRRWVRYEIPTGDPTASKIIARQVVTTGSQVSVYPPLTREESEAIMAQLPAAGPLLHW